MITEIQMDAVASFRHPTSIVTDKKVNLVYGLNGTGKSTISNFLYDTLDLQFTQCREIQDNPEPILVYNQTFIRDNFFVSDSLKGIFSLSKENKAAEEKIVNAMAHLGELELRRKNKRTEKQQILKTFGTQKQQAADETWKIRTTYSGGDRVLEYCLDGLKGQKDRLFAHLQSVTKPENEPARTIQELRDEVERLKGQSAQPQSSLPYINLSVHDIESAPIFIKSIIGNTDSEVAALIERLDNADWVHQGLAYIPKHIDNETQPCPFCQQSTITKKLAENISNYFDDTYQDQIKELEALREIYLTARDEMPDASTWTSHKFATDRSETLSVKYQALIDGIGRNILNIEEKIRNPRTPRPLEDTTLVITEFNSEIKVINNDIQVYNNRLKDRDTALHSIKSEFWSIMRWQYDQTISRFEKDRLLANQQVSGIEDEIKNIDSEITSTKTQIATAQKETVNVDEAVSAINAGLLDLGIDDFKINKHSETLYRVVRAGESEDAFHTLSEGEKMMISFLYFCELCKGRSSADDTQDKRIVVIDDPISSLSHVFIFNVGQLIKSVFFKSDRFSQVFVLTHSLYFFYELTDTNHDRRKESQKLFRISKPLSGSIIQEMKYEEIQNDYQAYWSVINDPSQPPALIANCMRNIIEYFFNFVRKRDLNNVFQMPELQDLRFQAFCRYVNRESHSLGQNIIDMKEFDYNVFKDGLRLVFEKTGYPEHFNAMSKM